MSEQESKGMKKELKLAKDLNKRNILVIKEGLNFENFRKDSDNVIEYNNFESLKLTVIYLKSDNQVLLMKRNSDKEYAAFKMARAWWQD